MVSARIANFEATHGAAPKYAGQDKVNSGSLILSAEMMLRYMECIEAANLAIPLAWKRGPLRQRPGTYDFERLMPDATLLKCSEFGDVVISTMDESFRMGTSPV